MTLLQEQLQSLVRQNGLKLVVKTLASECFQRIYSDDLVGNKNAEDWNIAACLLDKASEEISIHLGGRRTNN